METISGRPLVPTYHPLKRVKLKRPDTVDEDKQDNDVSFDHDLSSSSVPVDHDARLLFQEMKSEDMNNEEFKDAIRNLNELLQNQKDHDSHDDFDSDSSV